MNDKEFVLVSQGIEIYRTKSQENAVNMVKEYNDEYFNYLQKCYDNYERPADNYVDLEIEYSNEKDKDKEIERLNNIIKGVREERDYLYNKYSTEAKYLAEKLEKANNIINELEKYIKESCWKDDWGVETIYVKMLLNKLQELKGVYKE